MFAADKDKARCRSIRCQTVICCLLVSATASISSGAVSDWLSPAGARSASQSRSSSPDAASCTSTVAVAATAALAKSLMRRRIWILMNWSEYSSWHWTYMTLSYSLLLFCGRPFRPHCRYCPYTSVRPPVHLSIPCWLAGTSRATAEPRKTFLRGLSVKIFFAFLNGAFWCTLYLWATAGPPNVAGPGVAYPYLTLFDGPAG